MPNTNSQTTSRASVGQAVIAVIISAVAYLGLIFFEQNYGQGLKYSQSFFGRWSVLLCLLLTGWSLIMLFVRWRKSANRAAAIRNSSFPTALPPGEPNFDGVLTSLKETGQRHGDDIVVDRAATLVQEYKATHDAGAVTATLTAESEAAQADVDSNYAPIRIFAWTIPILGLIGTVLGIGQAIGDFAIFLSTGSQKQEAIRAALYQSTLNLGAAFQATLVAVLLTCIIGVAYLLLTQKEKSLLRDLDHLMRAGLLPLMQRQAPASAAAYGSSRAAAAVAEGGSVSGDAAGVRATFIDLRNSIGEVTPVLRNLADHLREQAGDAASRSVASAGSGD